MTGRMDGAGTDTTRRHDTTTGKGVVAGDEGEVRDAMVSNPRYVLLYLFYYILNGLFLISYMCMERQRARTTDILSFRPGTTTQSQRNGPKRCVRHIVRALGEFLLYIMD